MEHTKTPWKATTTRSTESGHLWLYQEAVGGGCQITVYDGENPGTFPLLEVNRAFIIRACNAHDSLVEACNKVITAAEIIDSSESPTNDDIDHLHSVIQDARAALAKAKGE